MNPRLTWTSPESHVVLFGEYVRICTKRTWCGRDVVFYLYHIDPSFDRPDGVGSLSPCPACYLPLSLELNV